MTRPTVCNCDAANRGGIHRVECRLLSVLISATVVAVGLAVAAIVLLLQAVSS